MWGLTKPLLEGAADTVGGWISSLYYGGGAAEVEMIQFDESFGTIVWYCWEINQ